MIQCPRCAETVDENEAEHCPYCGNPLTLDDGAPFRPAPSYVREPRYTLVMAVDGAVPSGETTLLLTEQEKVIGRSDKTDFRIALPSISRRHAAFWVQAGLAYARDLGSQHGTFLNYHPITEATALRPGDRVSLGSEVHFHLVVQEADEDEATHPCEGLAEIIQEAPGEISLPPARPVSGDLPRPGPDVGERAAKPEKRHMEVLSAYCSATVKVAGEDELFIAALEHLAQLLCADRFFAMVGRALETLTVVAQIGDPDPPPSRGIMRRVLYSLSDRPFVTCDAQAEKGISNRTSVMMSNVRSVMCVGLVVGGACEGMIYVDTLGSDQPFNADDEDFLHVIGQITAVRMANIRNRAELEALEEELQGRVGAGGGGLKPVEIS